MIMTWYGLVVVVCEQVYPGVDRTTRVGTCFCRLKYVAGVIKEFVEICDKKKEKEVENTWN